MAAVLAAVIAAPPAEVKPPIEILSSKYDHNPDGSYEFSFEGADGSSRQEKGIVINPGTDNEAVVVEGVYKYLDAENKPVEVHYTGNEKGFLPEGGHIDPAISNGAKLVSENVDVEEEKH